MRVFRTPRIRVFLEYSCTGLKTMPTGEKTATVRTVDNGEQEISSIVDGKEFTVTEASVRRHLQLADADGVHTPGSDEERFEQYELTGNVQQQSNDSPLSRGHTLRSGEDSIELIKKFMETYTKLSKQVSAQGKAHSQKDQPEDLLGVFSTAKLVLLVWFKKLTSVFLHQLVKDKGKDTMEEYEDKQTKRTKLQQEQDMLSHDAVVRLQEELDEEERQRMARVHERLQAEERNKYCEVDQAKILVDLNNQRKRYFTAQKAKEKRNKPMTQAQQRAYMSTYIKNMGNYTLNQLKNLSFDEIKELFETTMKIVNTFIPIETEVKGRASVLVAGSSQATITDSTEVGSSKGVAEAKLDYEGSKRQKTNEASGKYWKIIRVGNHTEAYQFFDDMLKAFDMDDLVMLWSLVKERFSLTKPTDDKERTLWVELKRFFEPDTDDTLWKLQRYMHGPLTWRLYDTCGVHHVSTEKRMDIFMSVEKENPLSKGIMTLLLVNKLLVDQYS
nr:hypothetical protein [Tanacetum cinerariifolium]